MATKSIGSLFIDIQARTAQLETDVGKVKSLLQSINVSNQSIANSANAANSAFAGMAGKIESVGLKALVGARLIGAVHREVMNVISNIEKIPGVPPETITSVMELRSAIEGIKLGFDHAVAGAINFMVQWGKMIGVTAAAMAGYTDDNNELSKLDSPDDAAAAKDKNYWEKVAAARSENAKAKEADKIASMELGVRMDYLIQKAKQYEAIANQSSTDSLTKMKDLAEASKLRTTVDTEVTKLQKELTDSQSKLREATIKVSESYSTVKEKIARVREEMTSLQEVVNGAVTYSGDDKKGYVTNLLAAVEGTKRYVTLLHELGGLMTRLKEPMDIMRNTFVAHMENMGDVLAKFFVEGTSGFRDFFRTLLETMVSTFLKMAVINPMLNAMFGGMTGFTSLPAMFADGGPYPGNAPFIAGEHGPELVVPGGFSGTVIPAGKTSSMMSGGGSSGGGSSIVINQNFSSGLTHQEFMASLPGIIAQTKAAVHDAVQRGGGYARVFANA